ncbi:hypothetical protein QAD02_010683 [Eretmocerus hayati]|uniref:Uncharacterized protein n=1 Tax=Eretmocerus hayati TaxID=131215 RepID=A0ACC2NUY7_9HYME|nr:hypothetical protein QAD02_010683 [Eretmocerus hayati]
MSLPNSHQISSSNLLFFSYLAIFHAVGSLSPRNLTGPVRIQDGVLYGEILRTVEHSKLYSAFIGIPYAKPPVGDLRFKPPQKVNPWNKPLQATSGKSKMCVQIVERTQRLGGSEDCLYLNVFSPHTEYNEYLLKPVMVWIHGGSYNSGNSDISFYGPDYLVEEDVIVVTFNYRLGPFGFLNLHHEGALGNAGLKDQNLALKWVKQNIIKFGGDPSRITIFGHSAGAVSVNLHLLSDTSVGLFKQSIAMSGSPLCLWWGFQRAENAIDSAFELAAKLGIIGKDKDFVLKQLLRIPAPTIMNATRLLKSSISFRPTIESTTVAPDQGKFLTECTLSKLHKGNFSKGTHLMGFTSAEAVSFISDDRIKLVKTLDSIMSFLKIGNWSLFDKILDVNSKTDTDKAIQVLSDLLFELGIDSQQKLLSAHNGGHPVYYYLYSFDPENSTHKADGRKLEGAAHGDELPSLFYRPFLNLPLNNPKMNLARRRMVRLWTNFAKFGNPTPKDQKDYLLNVTWPNSGLSGRHLSFGDELTIDNTRPTSPFVKMLQKLGFGEFYHGQDCPNASSAFKKVTESTLSQIVQEIKKTWSISV